MTISALAADLGRDRTTLGRNLQPLEHEGLVAVVTGRTDRRSREIRLTDTGAGRFRSAVEGWVKAQGGSRRCSAKNAARSCALLHAVSASELEGASPRALRRDRRTQASRVRLQSGSIASCDQVASALVAPAKAGGQSLPRA